MDHAVELLLGPLGTLVLALLGLFSFYKKWIVPGWLYQNERAEKNEWKDAALRGTRVAERVVTLHEVERKDRESE